MSRSWERMVQKNKKQLNKQRKKQGKESIYSTSSTQGEVFKGRKYALPIFLVILAAFYAFLVIATYDFAQQNGTAPENMTMNWVIVGLYILLAVMIFLRRPYLRVEKNAVYTTRFNRERALPASEITKIVVNKGSVVLERNKKGGNWVFTRLINRYDTAAMGESLEKFAKNNNIPFENSAK